MTRMQTTPTANTNEIVDFDRSINMDCMEISELRELCDRTPESFAADGYNDKEIFYIREYARYKELAMFNRLSEGASNIERALENERNCDRIYGRMPEPIRW